MLKAQIRKGRPDAVRHHTTIMAVSEGPGPAWRDLG